VHYFLAYFYFKIFATLDFKIKITLYGSTLYFIPVCYKIDYQLPMSKLFIFFAASLLLFGCGTYDLLLENRPLNAISNTNRTQFQVVHIGGKTYLLVRTDVAAYQLIARAYNEYDGNDKIWENLPDDLKPCPFASWAKYVEVVVPERVKTYGLHVTLQNEATRYVYSDILLVNRHQDNAQTIQVYTADDGQLLPTKYIKKGTNIHFGHNSDTAQNFAIRYYPTALPIAVAPSSTKAEAFNPLRAAAEFSFVKRGEKYTFDRLGTYFVQTDSSSNKGIFLTCVDSDFPKMSNLGDLIEAMRYITKNDEYELLNTSEDKKEALDRYWLARSPDKERARGLLRTYYRRAETANFYFTAEQAGWRTDRGIIFIVFGKPKNIRKFANSEVWLYTQTNYRAAVEFVFKRKGEIFTLQRDETYRGFWDSEVIQWRNGVMHLE
jgi:GWxTD domain-containing protein